VGSTILVQTVSSCAETEEFLAVADASDGLIAGVVGWVDLTAPDLDRLRTVPGGHLLVGIRHQAEDEPDPRWLLRPDVRRGLRPYADHVLSCFGADRVMFGSDWPVCELAGSYAEVLALTEDLLSGATAGERAAVLAGTARSVYRI